MKNPGLQHIIENVFLNLDYEDLLACQLINNYCKGIIENPMFWLKKWRMRGLSKKNEKDWAKVIQNTKDNPNEEIDALLYIKLAIIFLMSHVTLSLRRGNGRSLRKSFHHLNFQSNSDFEKPIIGGIQE